MKSAHESARGHVTGSAEYIDDRPLVAGEVHVEVFYSTVARARIKSLDLASALRVPGVLGIYTSRDLHHNLWGSILQDQPFLAENEVQYVGEPIAVIAAESKSAALSAKLKIQIEFEKLNPIFTIDEARANNDFIGVARQIQRGDVDNALAKAPHRLRGQIKMAGQDHFYLESQASIAYPKEDNQIEIHSSSQHPTEVQHLVAEALGLKFHQVVCVVKRMGGAFGGKESQAAPFAVFASLVAQKLNRPARLILSKDDDMIMTGKRNPFQNDYEVGFDGEGRILALKAKLFSDSGAYADLSTAIMERAMLHLDNAYFIPNFSVVGQVCKTNTPPTTAFRGFGGPKGVVTIESIIEDIAQFLNLDSLSVRERNVYRKGQTTPYGQTIDDDVLPDLFRQMSEETDYKKWRAEIEAHNKSNATTVRGLSATAVKFGISFTTRFLNQGNALVNVHLDGTVQVSTGATEMGQGVNTKIAQIVADCFAISTSDVRVMPTSTEKNPNTSATAASSGSDINGQAALNASLIIKNNLNRVAQAVLSRSKDWRGWRVAGAGSVPEIDISNLQYSDSIVFENGFVFDKTTPQNKISFSELLDEAYLNRVPLTAQGHFKYPGIFYNKETGQGSPFFYFTNGVAASEVSIDRRTGEQKVLRTEIFMDLGRPINEGIDIGQVTGAFVQGLGWVTTENLFYHEGRLVSCSPSTYKIPSIHDIPRIFNCRLIHNPLNERNVKGSKAVGEPPLLLAISVWAAIKNALQTAKQKPIELRVPATQEQIFMNLRGSDGPSHREPAAAP
jgi:xanthine dehydrogenase large subunit